MALTSRQRDERDQRIEGIYQDAVAAVCGRLCAGGKPDAARILYEDRCRIARQIIEITGKQIARTERIKRDRKGGG